MLNCLLSTRVTSYLHRYAIIANVHLVGGFCSILIGPPIVSAIVSSLNPPSRTGQRARKMAAAPSPAPAPASANLGLKITDNAHERRRGVEEEQEAEEEEERKDTFGNAHASALPGNEPESSQTKSLPLPLPQAFLDFLIKGGVDPSIYSAVQHLPRYVRLKPGFEDELPEIEVEMGIRLTPVSWLQGFFSVPYNIHIAGSKAYRHGKIYGMDAASGAAVVALGVMPGDHVLDLCAAPGTKLCMFADHLGSSGSLTGVDIAHHRLAACRTVLQKYGLGRRCRLFAADGVSFSLLPFRQSGIRNLESKHPFVKGTRESQPYAAQIIGGIPTYGEWTSRRTFKEKRIARRAILQQKNLVHVKYREPELFYYGTDSGVLGLTKMDLFENSCENGQDASISGYDKVLVDAECTHDGSFKHICKFEQWGWDTLERRVLDNDRLASITSLQLQLLSNGFRLLKVGGCLVYSTCSFMSAQNEEVVKQFLAGHANADLKDIVIAKNQNWPCKSGGLAHTLRFDPLSSRTSGLFIAKIVKQYRVT